MRAIVQDRYGGPEVLQVRDVPVPQPGTGELLVKVHAASVNAADWHTMRGEPKVARRMTPRVFGKEGPKRAGRGQDFAGVVAALGHGVADFAVGDEVFGELPMSAAHGSFAEYTVASPELTARKPAGLSFEQAAALGLAADTALQAVRDAGGVCAGQKVLIIGASGGVGTYAVQLAKADGASVTAIGGPGSLELLQSLGADEVIDYTELGFWDLGRRWDVVIDLAGSYGYGRLRRTLVPGGTLVLSGGGDPEGGYFGAVGVDLGASILGRIERHHVTMLVEKPDRAHLDALRELAESGALRPVLDRSYPLEETAEAVRRLEREHVRGKIVVTVGE